MITYDELEQLKNIKHGLIRDLIEYGKKDGKLNEVDTLAHAIKNMCKIIEDGEMEMYSGNSYSGGYSMAPMMNGYGWANDGYSQARGRGPGAARDSMGRYSSHGDLVSQLYSVMNSAQNDSERQEIQSLINRMQNR